MLQGKRVWVAGHNGMVGSALVRKLGERDCEILTVGRRELDLREPIAVKQWMREMRPDVIFVAAAKVGGIRANSSYPAQFLYDNLMIEAGLIHGAWENGTEKLIFLGSSCIYPREAQQPIQESALLSGYLEATNEAYAIAKITGIKLVEAYRSQYGCDFISAMPTNLYGPNDNFDLDNSHVLPALIRKMHEAKINKSGAMTVWGTGAPLREFLHVDDCAEACIFLAENYSGFEHVNVGFGEDISIAELAALVQEVVEFSGQIIFDPSMPDGTPRKLMDNGKINRLGWKPSIPLRSGIENTYRWYLEHRA